MTTVSFDGRSVAIVEGDSIAAALMRAGIFVLRRSRSGEPRGIFCGIGICNDCLVTVDGRPNVRACITPAEAGLVVEMGTDAS